VLFRKSPASGRLTFSCDECDSTGYADPGGIAFAKWSASLKADPSAIPTPAPSPPAPTPRRSSGLLLDQAQA
jgi:hypothetical protein